jgi:hypothetical protein
MKHRILYFISIVSILILMTGCKKGDIGPAGPSLTGDLIGYAFLYDVNGNQLVDNSSITVSIDGNNISATTAADGRWVLSGIKTGTYNLTFTKAGYGTHKTIGMEFVGGGQAYYGSEYLYQIPSFTITGLSATTSTGQVNIAGTLYGSLPTSYYRYIRLFIGTSPTVSSDPKNYAFTNLVYAYNSSTSFSSTIDKQTINYSGISSGQTIYIVAYAASSYGYDSYIDITTGKYYYPSINPTPSNVVSVVVP